MKRSIFRVLQAAVILASLVPMLAGCTPLNSQIGQSDSLPPVIQEFRSDPDTQALMSSAQHGAFVFALESAATDATPDEAKAAAIAAADEYSRMISGTGFRELFTERVSAAYVIALRYPDTETKRALMRDLLSAYLVAKSYFGIDIDAWLDHELYEALQE